MKEIAAEHGPTYVIVTQLTYNLHTTATMYYKGTCRKLMHAKSSTAEYAMKEDTIY